MTEHRAVATTLRPYEPERDFPAVRRIWEEVGWLEDEDEARYLPDFLAAGVTEVGCIDDQPECAVHRTPGQLLYAGSDLPLCAITAVTTSRVGRQLGFASRLTARALAAAAEEGAAVAALGMFDQGFYDRLGFGSGPYEHELIFDPATLDVSTAYRTPRRLTADDWEAIHRALANRKRSHGNIVLPAGFVKAELGWMSPLFALGYFDGEELTHFVAGEAEGEFGPYRIRMLAYRNEAQLLELLALLRALADQVASCSIIEPAGVQLQDFLRLPFRHMRATRGSKHENHHRSFAWWQARMLDLSACLRALCPTRGQCTFNLRLTDPLAERADPPWPGLAGSYVVTLGAESFAEPGHDPRRATMDASVGAFTRLWLGVRPARSLALSDQLSAPVPLLDELEELLSLPTPTMGLDF